MPLNKLAKGFLEFRDQTFLPQRSVYEGLARGQNPKVMMIGCSDSRVDPGVLTKAAPGELFLVRNVANLVPPCAADRARHGVSAALEFGVVALGVEHIVVLGHVDCGGIKALLHDDLPTSADPSFIDDWLQIASEARRRTLIKARGQPEDVLLRVLEQEAIKTSLANLLSFPWIEERVADGRLRLHGWCFDIHQGELQVYVPAEDGFAPLTLERMAAFGAT